MAELTLEPYAVVQHWHLPAVDGEWESILGEYLQSIALRCISAEKCVIGHIKALALFPNEGFLRISVVAANIPATIEGGVPTGCSDIELTLNVLVYGLGKNTIEQITQETANEIAFQRQGTVRHNNTNQAGEHRHHSDHEDHSKGDSMSDQLKQAMSDLEEEKVLQLVQERLIASGDPLAILTDCREGMALVGKRYEAGEYYVSDLIMAGEIFKQATALVGTKFDTTAGEKKGKVVVGTVKGDIHDIGKDLVVSLLKANGYDVIDLGVDVPAEKFVEAVQSSGAPVVGLSGLLTISFDAMKATVDALEAAGLRSGVKVMIGGGPVTEQVRAYASADAVGADAQAAVALVDGWIESKEVA